jgi:hypothetical protein
LPPDPAAYRDTGCHWAPRCLRCPLPICWEELLSEEEEGPEPLTKSFVRLAMAHGVTREIALIKGAPHLTRGAINKFRRELLNEAELQRPPATRGEAAIPPLEEVAAGSAGRRLCARLGASRAARYRPGYERTRTRLSTLRGRRPTYEGPPQLGQRHASRPALRGLVAIN